MKIHTENKEDGRGRIMAKNRCNVPLRQIEIPFEILLPGDAVLIVKKVEIESKI